LDSSLLNLLITFFLDTTDDILAKYRRKPSAASDTASIESNQSRTKEVEDERLSIDPNNVELSYAFADAKRKLRMVLSTADLQHIPWNTSEVLIIVLIFCQRYTKFGFFNY